MQQEVAMLILQRAEGGAARWPLDRNRLLIGRDPDCDVILPERVVSRHHASIERRHDGYYLADNGSKNGTFVNGEPVGEGVLLRDGDDIQIALRFRLTFVDAGATAPLTADLGRSQPAVGLRLDDTRRAVEIHGRLLDPPLSAAQYRLLATLLSRPGRVFPLEALVEAVWGYSGDGDRHLVKGLVNRVRRKIEPAPQEPIYLLTEAGVGYRFDWGDVVLAYRNLYYSTDEDKVVEDLRMAGPALGATFRW